MKKDIWFKPKRYGCGFYPVSVAGWLMTCVFLALTLSSAYINNLFENQMFYHQDGIRFLLDVVLLTGLFTYIGEKKMDEELKWRWGGK